MGKTGMSYFMRTFHINGFLLFTIMLLVLARFPFKMIEVFLKIETSPSLTEYSKIIAKVLGAISNTLDGLIVLSVGILLIFLVPELITRIVQDSLVNWFYSIWISFRLRKFLIIQADHEGEGISKLQQHNKAIRKSVIDVRKKKITYIAKLPNNVQAQKLILEIKEILREEIASHFPDYTLSNFERYKHWLRIEGTKIR